MRLPVLILVVSLSLLSSGCALFAHMFSPPPVYRDRPVPADVFDASTLAAFQRLNLTPAPQSPVVMHDDGRIEPGGVLLPEDYQPESYGREMCSRLDLGSFPSLIVVPRDGTVFTHRRAPWSEGMQDKTSCGVTSSYADATYRVIATFDYTGSGTRDWLVAASQQARRDEQLMLTLWLVVEDPRAEGPLRARLVALEERRGLAPATPYRDEDAARSRLEALRKELRFPPLEEK